MGLVFSGGFGLRCLLGGRRRPDPDLVRRAGRFRTAYPFGQPLRHDFLRQAHDHDQREVPTQHRLATGVDVAAQLFHGGGHGRHNARVVVGHHVEDIDVFESGHGVTFGSQLES